MRTHVLLLSGTALSGHNGSSRAERRLAEALAADHDVTLMTRDDEPLTGAPFAHVTYRRPTSQEWKLPLLAARVSRAIEAVDRARPVHLVHAFATFPCALYAASGRWPYVITHHNMELLPRSPLVRRATRKAIEGARASIALNAAQAEALRSLGARDVHVIHNGVGEEEPADTARALPPRFVLFAGRLEAEKGVHLLLEAYAALPARSRRPLVIAGDGRDADEVRARAEDLGALALPWLDHRELLAVLARAEQVVLPTQSEASPLLLLEAFARGVPAAVHDLPMIAEVLRDDDGAPRATRVPVGDVAAWSAVLSNDAPAADPAMLARARAWAAARAWPDVAARYARVYAACLAGAGGRHSTSR